VLEKPMAKNKGGREVRKPKQDKKPKPSETASLMAKADASGRKSK
jgi:hypothetical protein